MLIVTDPGPDPDDIKVIVSAGMLHKSQVVNVEAFICNGGHQARERTALCNIVLEHIGMRNQIPVGIGEEIKAYTPKAHEYALPGYEGALRETMMHPELFDGKRIFMDTLRNSVDKSLTVQVQTGMTDVANMILEHGHLFERKVSCCSIMGGLQQNGVTGEWEPDTAANNMFDFDACKIVYKFCIDRGIPMHVVSRTAVPNLRMTLAKEFADAHKGNVVMDYLYKAQKLGLVGLWGAVCAKKLPPRCTKMWYFTTFCGLTEEDVAEYDLVNMTAEDNMEPWLQGTVKPYDVVAFMTLLPNARDIFDFDKAEVEINGVKHYFFLKAEQAPSLKNVEEFLSSVYTATSSNMSGSKYNVVT